MIIYEQHFRGKMLLDQCIKCFYVRYVAWILSGAPENQAKRPGLVFVGLAWTFAKNQAKWPGLDF